MPLSLQRAKSIDVRPLQDRRLGDAGAAVRSIAPRDRCRKSCRVVVAAVVVIMACLAPAPAYAVIYNLNVNLPGQGATPFRMWLPDAPSGGPVASAPVRGMIFLQPGSGGDWREQAQKENFQKAANVLGLGIIGTPNVSLGATGRLEAVMSQVAAVSGRPELVNAPFATIGLSAGGFSGADMASNNPQRAIAQVNIRSGYAGSPSNYSALAPGVPAMNIVASLDSIVPPDSTYFGWLPWRQLGGPTALAVEWDSTHYDTHVNQSWEFAWLWIGQMIKLRYPDPDPLPEIAGDIPQLETIDTSSGWLGFTPTLSSPPFDPPEFVDVAEIGDVTFPHPTLTSSWMPNESFALAYRAFTSFEDFERSESPRQTPLQILLNPIDQDADIETPVFQVGDTVEVGVDLRDAAEAGAPCPDCQFGEGFTTDLDGLDIYLGEQFRGRFEYDGEPFASPGINFRPIWTFDVTFTEPGIQPLVVVGRDSEGREYTSFRAVLVVPLPVPEPGTLTLAILGAVVLIHSLVGHRCARPTLRR